MQPRKDANYFKLPQSVRGLYLTGMPAAYLKEDARSFNFRNEKTSKGVLTQAIQRQTFDQFLEVVPGEQQFTLFASAPTDHEALLCCTQILKNHWRKNSYAGFEFVSPSEIPPRPSEDMIEKAKSLYILVGVHFKDLDVVHQVRRWVRTPHGSAVWVIGTGEGPLEWATTQLGVKPSFLFSLKETGTSVG
jgi:hypothetical protein